MTHADCQKWTGRSSLPNGGGFTICGEGERDTTCFTLWLLQKKLLYSLSAPDVCDGEKRFPPLPPPWSLRVLAWMATTSMLRSVREDAQQHS